jgi:hypothetical protein
MFCIPKRFHQDLDGRIEWVVEGGPCEFGLESTVLSALEGQAPVILRPGSITPEHLRQYLPDVSVFKVRLPSSRLAVTFLEDGAMANACYCQAYCGPLACMLSALPR